MGRATWNVSNSATMYLFLWYSRNSPETRKSGGTPKTLKTLKSGKSPISRNTRVREGTETLLGQAKHYINTTHARYL